MTVDQDTVRRTFASALLLAAVAVGGPAAPAGASGATTTWPSLPPAQEALIPLQAEVMLLVELGAFAPPLPPRVQQVHDDWVAYTQGMPRPMLLSWLADADRDGLGALDRLRASGEVPSQPVVTALSELSDIDRDALVVGGHVTPPAQVYEQALFDLDGSGDGTPPWPTAPTLAPTVPVPVPWTGTTTPTAPAATAPAAPVTRPPSVATTAAALVARATGSTPPPTTAASDPATAPTPVPAPTTGAPPPGPAGDAASPTTTVAVAAPTTAARATTTASGGGTTTAVTATVELAAQERKVSAGMAALWMALTVAVTAAGWMLTRRSVGARRILRPGRIEDLLEAGRRLTAAGDRSEVVRAAVAEAVAVTAATAGVFVERDADGSVHVLAPHPLLPSDLTRGPIPRALSSGMATRSQRPGRSLLVAPVVHDGTVLGALAVIRPPAFTAQEQDLLCRLAPLVAGALHAATRHEAGAELAYQDALTDVGNRRRFERDLDALAADGTPLVVAMVDVDHFKQFNDRHGHQRGDDALRLVADALRRYVRRRDLVYRYGGEEFSILLPGATEAEATAVAERIRAGLAAAAPPCGEDHDCRLTVSIGVATSTHEDPREAVARADEALYEAKRTGRDRVVVAR